MPKDINKDMREFMIYVDVTDPELIKSHQIISDEPFPENKLDLWPARASFDLNAVTFFHELPKKGETKLTRVHLSNVFPPDNYMDLIISYEEFKNIIYEHNSSKES